MDTKYILASAEKFFLDIIGMVLPGGLLLFCILAIDNNLNSLVHQKLDQISIISPWALFLAGSYILGYAELSIGEWIAKILMPYKPQDLKANWSYMVFRDLSQSAFSSLNNADKNSIDRDLRNLAMSVAPEINAVVYRFMFVSLFNMGVSVSCILSVLYWLIIGIIFAIKNHSLPSWPIEEILIAIFALIISLLCRYQAREFFRRSQNVPFSQAIAKYILEPYLLKKKEVGEMRTETNSNFNKKPNIYLAGGFASGWQSKVKKDLNSFEFADPSVHNLKNSKEYTEWDLMLIKRADIVFAFLESDNPGGYALALEIGFARALGKLIILVNEKVQPDGTTPYLNMVESSSNIVFRNIDDGIAYLKKIANHLEGIHNG
jgi:hypothetical protein